MGNEEQPVRNQSAAAFERVLMASTNRPLVIEPSAFYPERDVASLLGVAPDTLRRRRHTHSDLPFCRYGRRVYYRGADIIAALEASRRLSTSDLGGRVAKP